MSYERAYAQTRNQYEQSERSVSMENVSGRGYKAPKPSPQVIEDSREEYVEEDINELPVIRLGANICRSSVQFGWREEALWRTGTRHGKHYFVVDQQRGRDVDQLLLATVPRSQSALSYRKDDSLSKTLERTLRAFESHKYLWPVLCSGYSIGGVQEENSGVEQTNFFFYRPFCASGSLRDLIYRWEKGVELL
jgi:hypothetical protein